MAEVTPENLLETREFFRTTIKDVKGQLNPVITGNPKFEELLYNEMQFFMRKTYNTDFDVIVAEDKNSVSITSYCPLMDCRMPEFRGKNRAFLKTVFYLKDNNLVCDYSQGVLFDRKLLEENGMRTGLAYESKLETSYSLRYFTEDGIEYSNNSYSDVYPFSDHSEDIDLRERTLSSFHKPVFNEYQLAIIPIHVMNASVRNTYRKSDSLAVIHSNVATATRDGYKNVNCALFTCHPSMPEMLRGETMFARSEGNPVMGFRFNVVNDYAKDVMEGYEKAKEEFKNAIVDCNLKEYSRRTYDSIINAL